jgi:hypothetical protein
MTQYTQGGHITSGQDYPTTSGPGGQQGTPLARIVLGVFLGLLAWSLVMCVAGAILLAVAANQVEDAFNGDTGTSTSGTLSDACKATLNAGGDGTATQCATDDSGEVFRYIAELDTK